MPFELFNKSLQYSSQKVSSVKCIKLLQSVLSKCKEFLTKKTLLWQSAYRYKLHEQYPEDYFAAHRNPA